MGAGVAKEELAKQWMVWTGVAKIMTGAMTALPTMESAQRIFISIFTSTVALVGSHAMTIGVAVIEVYVNATRQQSTALIKTHTTPVTKGSSAKIQDANRCDEKTIMFLNILLPNRNLIYICCIFDNIHIC